MENCNGKNKKAIILFLVVTFILSSICYYIRIVGGKSAAGMESILMFCPALSAIIVKIIYFRKEKVLGLNNCSPKFVVGAAIIPIMYLGLSYGVYWVIVSESFSGQIYTTSIYLLLLGILSSIITAAGEEIGWRGFLLPRIAETWNMKAAVLFSGLIWAIWHFPLMIAGLYQTGTPIWYQLPIFTIEILMITTILGILRIKSKSVWPPIVLHASHNYFDQIFFSPLTKSKMSHFFVGETGAITVLFICLIAVILAKKLKITE